MHWAYKDCLLICLDHSSKHIAGLLASLAHQRISNRENSWKQLFDNLVKVVFWPVFEAVGTTDGEEALKTDIDRSEILSMQQASAFFQEARPLFGKVVVQDLLQSRGEEFTYGRIRHAQKRNDSITSCGLVVVADNLGVVWRRRLAACLVSPSFRDTILEARCS